jgi:hypothetical protein
MLRQLVVLGVLMAEMGFISFSKVVVEYLSFRKKQATPKIEFYSFRYNQNSIQHFGGLSKNN